MASPHQPPRYNNDRFQPHIIDGFHELRHPHSWVELSKACVYWNWFLWLQNTPALSARPARVGGMRTEVSALCNASVGAGHLRAGGYRKPTNTVASKLIISAGEDAFLQIKVRGSIFAALDETFKLNRIRHVDEHELEKLHADDAECPLCFFQLSRVPLNNWLRPVPVPKILFPEQVKFLPLSRDDRLKFTGMLTEIWRRIEDLPLDAYNRLPTPEPMEAVKVCCKHIAMAMMRYAAFSELGRQRAEVEVFTHPIVARSWEVNKMMENERHLANRPGQPAPPTAPRSEQASSEQAVETGCGHLFGIACLGEWLELHNTCPMCRRELLPSNLLDRLPEDDIDAYFNLHHLQ